MFQDLYNDNQLVLKDLRRANKVISGILAALTVIPNDLQWSLAQIACELKKKYTRQIYYVPGGQGKSFIANAIALILFMTEGGIKRIHMVYSNSILMKKDELDF